MTRHSSCAKNEYSSMFGWVVGAGRAVAGKRLNVALAAALGTPAGEPGRLLKV